MMMDCDVTIGRLYCGQKKTEDDERSTDPDARQEDEEKEDDDDEKGPTLRLLRQMTTDC